MEKCVTVQSWKRIFLPCSSSERERDGSMEGVISKLSALITEHLKCNKHFNEGFPTLSQMPGNCSATTLKAFIQFFINRDDEAMFAVSRVGDVVLLAKIHDDGTFFFFCLYNS